MPYWLFADDQRPANRAISGAETTRSRPVCSGIGAIRRQRSVTALPAGTSELDISTRMLRAAAFSAGSTVQGVWAMTGSPPSALSTARSATARQWQQWATFQTLGQHLRA